MAANNPDERAAKAVEDAAEYFEANPVSPEELGIDPEKWDAIIRDLMADFVSALREGGCA